MANFSDDDVIAAAVIRHLQLVADSPGVLVRSRLIVSEKLRNLQHENGIASQIVEEIFAQLVMQLNVHLLEMTCK